jgi:hypothetical protein
LFAATLLFVNGSFAQSTVFNAPSTDTQSEKKLLIETDFIAHFDKFEKGGFQSFGYRTVYGVRKNLEIGVNFFYARTGERRGPKELQPNFKYKFYENEKYGIAASGGVQFFIPLNRSAGSKASSLFYSNLSKVIKKTGETRVTGGLYAVAGGDSDFGTKRGVIAALEQPVFGKLSLTADWFSGKNRVGYASAGILLALTKRQYLQIGYSFGNSGRANNSLGAFYGFTY